jgi:hypothetical protein
MTWRPIHLRTFHGPARALLAIAATAVTVLAVAFTATAKPPASTGTVIEIGKKVALLPESPGQMFSTAVVPLTITCPAGSGPTQFNVFVSQPQAPNSFGFVTAQCTGAPEAFNVTVNSNFGTLYQEGPATVSVNCFFPCTATASMDVKLVRKK